MNFSFREKSEKMSSTSKEILRKQIGQILRSICSEERTVQSKTVNGILLQHKKYLQARSISLYVNMETEISTRQIFIDAFRSQKQVFIPRYDSQRMEMVRIDSIEDLDSLPMTKWKIRQPSLDDQRRIIADGNIDLVIVPAVAFSTDGSRLGHGKGFYDRYLKTLSENSYTIGLSFRQQLLENNLIPMTSNDVRLNEIIFPQ